MASYMNLFISHLNCANSPVGIAYLKAFQERYPDREHIISLNDPPLFRQKIRDLETFKVFRVKNKDKVGAAIAIRGGINFLPSYHLSSEDCVVGQVVLPDKTKFYIISIYMRPSVHLKTSLEKLQVILDTITIDNLPIVICSDTNCRSYAFGEPPTAKFQPEKGIALLDFVQDNDLIFNREFNSPTFVSYDGKRKSFVDQIMTNNVGIFERSSCVMINEDNLDTGVDHKHIALKFSDEVEQDRSVAIKSNCVRFNTKDVSPEKWELFKKVLTRLSGKFLARTNFDEVRNKSSADKAVRNLHRLIHVACTIVFARVKAKLGRAKPYYNTSQLREYLVKAKSFKHKWRVFLRLNQRGKALRFYSLYREQISIWYNRKRALASQNFRSFCNSNDIFKSYKIHSACKSTSHDVAALPDLEGIYATDVDRHLENILSNYVPNSTHPNIEDFYLRHSAEVDQLGDHEIKINSAIIESIIKSFGVNKAPGMDGFSAAILRASFEVLNDEFVKLYRSLIDICYFPKLWKIGNIILIPKPGVLEDNPTKKSYRPITLLAILGKVLEKLIIPPVYNTVYSQNEFCKTQFGFTRQTSTVDALIEFDSFIKSTIYGKGKNYCLAVLLDIKGAFDNAPYYNILRNLIARNCPGNLIRIIQSYFTDRKMSVNLSSINKTCKAKQGCPQGSVCGPSLWNILLDTLFDELHQVPEFQENIRFQAYADDTIIYLDFNDKNVNFKLDIINRALSFIFNWGVRNYLEFNASKTQAIVFNRKQNANVFNDLLADLKMNDVKINLSTSVKYLGVIFDHKHTFNEHLTTVVGKAKKELSYLGIHCKNVFGSNPEVTQKLVNSVIYPKLTYACVIWFQCLRRQYNLKKIRSLNYMCDKRICHSYRTSSMVSNAILSSNMPLELRIFELAQNELVKRTGIFPDFYESDVFNPFSTDYIDALCNQRDMITSSLTDSRFIYYIPSFQELNSLSESSEPTVEPRIHWTILDRYKYLDHSVELDDMFAFTFKPDLKVYTDGSSFDNNRGTGSGYTIQGGGIASKEVCFPLHYSCNNYQAEIMAICGALDNIYSNYSAFSSVIIYTDSESAIKDINSPWSNNPVVHSIRRYISLLHEENKSIYFKWVKAHTGIRGNELADELAKKGALLSPTADSCYNYISLRKLKTVIHNSLWKRWILYAFNEEKPFGLSKINDWLYEILYDHCRKENFNFFKGMVKLLNYYSSQFFNSHGAFGQYLHKMDIHDTPLCPYFNCNKVDDVPHTMFDCSENTMFSDKLSSFGINRSNLPDLFPRLIKNLDKHRQDFLYTCESIIKDKINSFKEYYLPEEANNWHVP